MTWPGTRKPTPAEARGRPGTQPSSPTLTGPTATTRTALTRPGLQTPGPDTAPRQLRLGGPGPPLGPGPPHPHTTGPTELACTAPSGLDSDSRPQGADACSSRVQHSRYLRDSRALGRLRRGLRGCRERPSVTARDPRALPPEMCTEQPSTVNWTECDARWPFTCRHTSPGTLVLLFSFFWRRKRATNYNIFVSILEL